ncbi:MAG: hypothetical protein HQL38_20705 [Alphaproteobacteria bacterium]|nr:hypothetical protein [Alphaproteobacteria bacterium]
MPAFVIPALLAALPFAFGLVALWLGMDANWDLRNYHWYNAYAYLEGRHGFDLLAAQIPTFHNPMLDVPFFVAAQALPARVVGFLLGSLHGLNALALYALGRRLGVEAGWALAAAVTGALGAAAVAEIGTVFYDNVLSLGFYASVLVIVSQWERLFGARAWVAAMIALAAGIPAGIAFGLKMTMVVYAVGACFGFLLAPDRPGRRLMVSFCFGLGVLAGLAVSAGPWMWFLWERYDNPMFPYFNQVFKSPWGLFQSYRDGMYLDKLTPANIFFFPFFFSFDTRLTSEVDFRDFRVLAAYLAVPLALVAWCGRGARGYLMAAVSLAYVTWLMLSAIYRYLIPLEMLAPLLLLLALGRHRAVAGVALALLLVTTRPADWGRAAWADKAVEVTLPAIESPDRTMVLMAGHEPLSFLLPAFPPAMRFLRIDSTFTNIRETNVRFNDVMRAAVAAHDGPLAMLFTSWEIEDVRRKLDEYGLVMDESRCRHPSSPIGTAPYAYCPVRRP